MGRINVEFPNMLLIVAQAVKLLDLPRFPPRPATSIRSKLNGRRNGNMLKIGGILPTHVTRMKRKTQEESGYKTQDSQKEKENEKAQEITKRH